MLLSNVPSVLSIYERCAVKVKIPKIRRRKSMKDLGMTFVIVVLIAFTTWMLTWIDMVSGIIMGMYLSILLLGGILIFFNIFEIV